MTDKTSQGPKTDAAKKSLTDGDIATFTRRTGPASGAPGSDVDTHGAIGEDDTAHNDTDTGAKPQKGAATDAHTDKDT